MLSLVCRALQLSIIPDSLLLALEFLHLSCKGGRNFHWIVSHYVLGNGIQD